MRFSSVLAILALHGAVRSIPLIGQTPLPSDFYILAGTVVDENQTPLPGAELTISRDGAVLAVIRADEAGAFSFRNHFGGLIEIAARQLGHKAETATLQFDTRRERLVMIVLERLATEIAAVAVSGHGRLDQFHENRKQYAFGRFMDREQIAKSNVRLTSDLFRSIPGATLRASRRYGNLVRFRGCSPLVWIDRVPIRDVELDELTVPEEIAGIEIYTSSGGVPPQFMDARGRSCGSIVVWTRIN